MPDHALHDFGHFDIRVTAHRVDLHRGPHLPVFVAHQFHGGAHPVNGEAGPLRVEAVVFDRWVPLVAHVELERLDALLARLRIGFGRFPKSDLGPLDYLLQLFGFVIRLVLVVGRRAFEGGQRGHFLPDSLARNACYRPVAIR